MLTRLSGPFLQISRALKSEARFSFTARDTFNDRKADDTFNDIFRWRLARYKMSVIPRANRLRFPPASLALLLGDLRLENSGQNRRTKERAAAFPPSSRGGTIKLDVKTPRRFAFMPRRLFRSPFGGIKGGTNNRFFEGSGSSCKSAFAVGPKGRRRTPLVPVGRADSPGASSSALTTDRGRQRAGRRRRQLRHCGMEDRGESRGGRLAESMARRMNTFTARCESGDTCRWGEVGRRRRRGNRQGVSDRMTD
ncbi:hypothetical protein KM043_004538 [Ampulex compressa]|nr:hypothetical protein KM043_004538 [Ampulex compressa]